MWSTTIRLAGRSVHLVGNLRDCDSCPNRAAHARVEARPFLQSEISRAAQGDASALADFRDLAARYGLLHDVHRVIDSRIREHVEWLLETERLFAVECVQVQQYRPAAPSAAPPEPVSRRPAVPVADLKTWVKIELLNETGKPVANVKYSVKVPGGEIKEGNLDANGRAWITGIDPGMCDVSFPEIDASEWKPA